MRVFNAVHETAQLTAEAWPCLVVTVPCMHPAKRGMPRHTSPSEQRAMAHKAAHEDSIAALVGLNDRQFTAVELDAPDVDVDC